MEDKKEIIGYKCFDENLQAFNGFQYEIGKTYEMEEDPEVGLVGFHFYNDLGHALVNSASPKEKICKVKILGKINSQNELNCTNKIEILEEVVIDEKTKESLLNELVDDEYWRVRQAVAEQGYGLDKLINDEHWLVRVAVGRQGYGLEKLVNDKDWAVREAIARQRYGLDKLINDENCLVREAVAEQGYRLDKLVNDKDMHVRARVFAYMMNYCPDLAQDIQQLIVNYFNKAED